MNQKEFDIYNFCLAIQRISSTNEKKIFIAQHKDKEHIKEFLKFMFDKQIVTGISNSKINKLVKVNPPIVAETFFDVLSYLKEHNTGSDVDIAVCQDYLQGVYIEEIQTMFKKIFTKTLRLGIDTKLVNTAIPNLIPVHEVQQANKLKDTKLKDGEWICLSEKLNGNRATYIDGKLISRQGKEFTNVSHITKELEHIEKLFTENMVFDGEIIRKNIDGISDNENFRIGTGILTSDVEDKTELMFVIFDLLPKSEFDKGESILTYSERMKTMCQVLEYITKEQLEHISVVDFLYAGNDHSMIETCLAQMDAEGKEGCMLARDVTYKCKRHSGLLKVKTFYTMDLEVIGMETGTGKNENTLGNLIVKYKDNTVGVGSGFSDDQRHEIWNNKDNYIGRIAEVRYKDITHDKTTGKESLQFPTFVQFREEGKEVSYA